jgi:phage shock protein C
MASTGLYKSRDKVLAGVCGGIADAMDMNPFGVRIAFVVLSIFSFGFGGIIAYVVLALMMKEPPVD